MATVPDEIINKVKLFVEQARDGDVKRAILLALMQKQFY